MRRRYAVLWDVESPKSREAGLVVERPDDVLVDVSSRYCIPARQRGEFTVASPDGTLVSYKPGDAAYFDQVLVALSNTFAVGERGEIEDTEVTVPELYAQKVTKALIGKERRSYPAEHAEQPYQPRIAEARATAERSRRALIVA